MDYIIHIKNKTTNKLLTQSEICKPYIRPNQLTIKEENKMSTQASVGMAMGIMVGLVICVILFRFANTDKRIKTQYDERQEAIKGRGYKYSFYTMMLCEVALMLLHMSDIKIPVENYLLHLGVILISCLVLCLHSIWNGVYWGLNNNHKRYYIIFAIAAVLNIIPIVAAFANNSISTEGFNSIPVMNIMVIVWLAIIGIVALVKKIASSKEDAEEV